MKYFHGVEMTQERFIFSTPKDIFKDRKPLDTRTFIGTDEIIDRKKQIYELTMVMQRILRGSEAFVSVYGVSGTGKTALVCSMANEIVNQYSDFVKVCYICCQTNKTEYQILAKICEVFGYPHVPNNSSSFYGLLEKTLKAENKSLLLILDEVSLVDGKDLNSLLYNLHEISQNMFRENHHCVSGILISNDMRFLDSINGSVRSRLGENTIQFPAYNIAELWNIVNDRVEKAVYKAYLSELLLSKCTQSIGQNSGDARECINTINAVYEFLEYSDSKEITEELITQAYEKIKCDKYKGILLLLPKSLKISLLAVINTQDKNVSSVYNTYLMLCKGAKIPKLSFRRFHQFIDELEKTNLIKTCNISSGRHGMKRVIEMNVEDNIVRQIKEIVESTISVF